MKHKGPYILFAAAIYAECCLGAIASRQVAKYNRATGKRPAVTAGDAKHLNSRFFWRGGLLCAHSI